MKLKKAVLLTLVASMAVAMVIFVAGCGDDENESEPAPTETEATEETTTTQAPKETDPLKTQLQSMIEQYGRGSADGKGVTYAKAVDMDGDGKPELVTIHDMKAEIFAVKGKKAESIFTGNIGIQYGQTSAGYEVLLNEKKNPVSLVLFNSTNEWVNENITVVTVVDGAAVEKNMSASTNGENDTPAREELVNFSIDGATALAADYNEEYDKLREGAESINPMNPADLDEVMAGM